MDLPALSTAVHEVIIDMNMPDDSRNLDFQTAFITPGQSVAARCIILNEQLDNYAPNLHKWSHPETSSAIVQGGESGPLRKVLIFEEFKPADALEYTCSYKRRRAKLLLNMHAALPLATIALGGILAVLLLITGLLAYHYSKNRKELQHMSSTRKPKRKLVGVQDLEVGLLPVDKPNGAVSPRSFALQKTPVLTCQKCGFKGSQIMTFDFDDGCSAGIHTGPKSPNCGDSQRSASLPTQTGLLFPCYDPRCLRCVHDVRYMNFPTHKVHILEHPESKKDLVVMEKDLVSTIKERRQFRQKLLAETRQKRRSGRPPLQRHQHFDSVDSDSIKIALQPAPAPVTSTALVEAATDQV